MAELIGMPRAAWKRQPTGRLQPSALASQLGIRFLVNFAAYPRDCVANCPLYPAGDGYVPITGSSGIGLKSISGTTAGFYTDNNPTKLQFQDTTIFVVFESTGGGNNGALLYRNMGTGTHSWLAGVYRGSYNGYRVTVNGVTSDYIGFPVANDGVFGSITHCLVCSMGGDELILSSNRKEYPSGFSYSGGIDYSRTDLGIHINLAYNKLGTYFTGVLYSCGIFDKKLDRAESKVVALNYWQLFAPDPPRFYLIPSGGSSPTSQISIDALIQRSGLTQTTSLDALLQSAFSRSLSIDGLIAAVQAETISLDALLQIVGTRTVSVDALVQAVKSGTVSVDALVQMTLAQSLSLDALIVAASASSASTDLDALIQSLKTAGISLDALLSQSKTATAVMDALIQASKTGSVSLDAIIAGASSTTVFVGLDALIQAIQAKTLSVDALLQKTYTTTLVLDAYVALTQIKTVSLDALLQAAKTGVISLDALIQMTRTATLSFDALIQAAKTGVISLDAILVFATQASLLLDAYVQKTLARGVGLDAIIGAIADMILPTGRVITVPASDRFVFVTHSDRVIKIQ